MKATRQGFFIFFIFFFTFFHVQATTLFDNEFVIGTLNGKKIKLGDLDDKQISDIRIQYYNMIEAKFKNYIVQEKIKNDPSLLPQNIKITDQEATRFYIQNKLNSRGTFPDLKVEIKKFLKQQKLLTAYNAIYDSQVKKKLVQLNISQPPKWMSQLQRGNSFVRGNQKGKVMLVEFSDYQCPYCKRVQPEINSLLKEYKEKVGFIFKHLPLSFHQQAENAANAMECAIEQNKFEEYHSLLFDNARNLNPQIYSKLAKQAKIENLSQFNQCYESKKYSDKVNADANDARSLGINGTPGFLIGRYDAKTDMIVGEIISGAASYEQFKYKIDEYLAKKNS